MLAAVLFNYYYYLKVIELGSLLISRLHYTPKNSYIQIQNTQYKKNTEAERERETERSMDALSEGEMDSRGRERERVLRVLQIHIIIQVSLRNYTV